MLAGIPGLFLGFLAFTQLQDKQRLSQKPAEIPHFKEYFALLKNRPFLFICLAHAMITFIIGGLSAWMPTYLHRYLQMDVARAGAVFGMLVVLCGAAGTYLGGKWADKMLPFSPKSYFWVIGLALAGLLPPAWIGIHTGSVYKWIF